MTEQPWRSRWSAVEIAWLVTWLAQYDPEVDAAVYEEVRFPSLKRYRRGTRSSP